MMTGSDPERPILYEASFPRQHRSASISLGEKEKIVDDVSSSER